MKLLIIACLITVCVGQNPQPPKFADTFSAEGEVEKHVAEKTLMGKFAIYRDQAAQMEALFIKYPEEEETRLLRYDMKPNHMAYFLRGPKDNCIKEARNETSKLPELFNWVNLAVYEGIRKVREVNYNLWGLTVADVRLEIAVDMANSTKPPFYYNRLSVEDFVRYSFMSFNATKPDPSVFKVPDTCTML